jgi:NAD(P)-dependent dehydrogenase (short-subunit alcohol dehydrogenase family)
MLGLKNKVALVTGGASGIGKAIATRLAAEGASVFITDTQVELGRQVASEGGLEFLEQDVSDEALWPEIVAKVEQRFGKLDILVNNAGILGPVDATPETAKLSDWKRIFAVNLEGVFLGCRAAIPAMRKAGGGAIVNISSITAQMPTNNSLAYGASKAAVRQLTKSVAEHCARGKLNIRCNSVHPGFTETPALLNGYADIARRANLSVEQVAEAGKARIPMGDYTLVEDIASAVAFLASDDARHVTGAKLIVDGGIIMD